MARAGAQAIMHTTSAREDNVDVDLCKVALPDGYATIALFFYIGCSILALELRTGVAKFLQKSGPSLCKRVQRMVLLHRAGQ